jgi:hypothetical protein
MNAGNRIDECCHCGKKIEGESFLSPSDMYGEAACCSRACADEQERVSNECQAEHDAGELEES